MVTRTSIGFNIPSMPEEFDDVTDNRPTIKRRTSLTSAKAGLPISNSTNIQQPHQPLQKPSINNNSENVKPSTTPNKNKCKYNSLENGNNEAFETYKRRKMEFNQNANGYNNSENVM